MLKGMLKRALGVVAAAAMAVTGAVALSGTANAADGETTAAATASITINSGQNDGVVEGHDFDYILIASYGTDADGNPNKTLTTNPAIKGTVWDAVKEVYTGNDPAAPEEQNLDPIVWAQNVSGKPMGDNTGFPWNGDSKSRQFAQALLDKGLPGDGEGVGHVRDASDPCVIENLVPGLYLVVDTTTGMSLNLPMLVGTKNDQLGAGGVIDVKNQDVNQKPEKTHEGDEDSASAGDTVTYTIKGEVPATAGKTGNYVFNDYASTGLTIIRNSISVYIETGAAEPEPATVEVGGFTVTPQGDGDIDGLGDENATPTFTVTIPYTALENYQQYAGQPLVLKYQAKLNGNAQGSSVKNYASVGKGEDESEKDDDTVYSTPIDFTKVDKNGKGLLGAEFKIEAVDPTPALTGSYTTPTATSGLDGKVHFAGLADGTYRITETKAPEGLMEDMTLPSFTVTIQNGVISGVTADGQGLVTWSNGYVDIKVMNVANASELPQTGAAGITMFIVIGLLIAGAGVTVYMKSRNVRRMMRA